MTDLMLDIETLGCRPTSVITQLGACLFDRKTGERGDSFIRNIDVADSLMAGFTIDKETVDWWRQQPDEYKTWITDCVHPKEALTEFTEFCKKHKPKGVWSHATFDIPILFNAYTITNIDVPFHYRVCRDIRTLVDIATLSKKSKKTIQERQAKKTHNALDDCVRQIEYCTLCFTMIKNET